MQIVEIRTDELVPYENNPRLNDNAVDYVKQSIETYGFKVPIIIDKNNVIVAGHTRHKAAKELGLKTVPCIIADDLNDDQIRAFRIADNKVSDFSMWDNTKLLEELGEIDYSMFTGFDVGGIFDDTLKEEDNLALETNEDGVTYEITFKSQDKAKIDQIIQLWEEIADEE